MLLYDSHLRDPRVSLKWRKEEAEDAVPFRRSTVSLAVIVFLLPAPLPPFPSEAEQLASQMAAPQTPLRQRHRNPRHKLRTSASIAPKPAPRPLWGPPAASQPPHLPYPSHGWWPRVHEHATPTIALVPWKLPALANPNGPPIRARPSPLPRHLPPVHRHRAPPSSLPSPPSKDAMARMPCGHGTAAELWVCTEPRRSLPPCCEHNHRATSPSSLQRRTRHRAARP